MTPLPRSGLGFWLVEANFPIGSTNENYYPDLRSDTPSVWNFFVSCFEPFFRLQNICDIIMGSTVAFLRSHLPSFPYVGMRRGGLSISSLHVRKAMTSLGFWIPRYRFRIPGSGYRSLCLRNLDYGFHSLVGSVILSCIPDSKTLDSGFQKENISRIPNFWNSTSKNLPDSCVLSYR